MVNAGCASSKGTIRVKEDYKNLAGSGLVSSKKGKNIPVMSLQDIVQKYKIKDGALKVDCEGCEYDTLLNTNIETLRKFKSILIEYHYGYADLEKKLKGSGFTVRHTKPEIMRNVNVTEKEMHGGTIYAKLAKR